MEQLRAIEIRISDDMYLNGALVIDVLTYIRYAASDYVAKQTQGLWATGLAPRQG